jgi:hypothetical protein
MLKASVLVLLALAALLCGASAQAACPPKQIRDCVINLDAVPQISQQIVTTSQAAPAAKAAPGAEAQTPYSGPTVGLTPTPRKFPTLGYRWSFD